MCTNCDDSYPVLSYMDEKVSSKIVKLIYSYTGIETKCFGIFFENLMNSRLTFLFRKFQI